MTPKVYFTDFCTANYETLPQKLARLIMTAGIDKIDFEGKFVAIKIHFGELGNMAHLRSGYARVLVDIIKDLGGKVKFVNAIHYIKGEGIEKKEEDFAAEVAAQIAGAAK